MTWLVWLGVGLLFVVYLAARRERKKLKAPSGVRSITAKRTDDG